MADEKTSSEPWGIQTVWHKGTRLLAETRHLTGERTRLACRRRRLGDDSPESNSGPSRAGGEEGKRCPASRRARPAGGRRSPVALHRSGRTLANLSQRGAEAHGLQKTGGSHDFWPGFLILLALAVSLSVTAASEVKKGEQVVLYPGLGWRTTNGWEAEAQGCVYEIESRRLTLPLLRRGLGIDEDELSAEERSLFQRRARLFLMDHQGGRTVHLRIAGNIETAGHTGENGRFECRVRISDELARSKQFNGNRLPIEAILPPAQSEPQTAEAFLLNPEGLSVISDIDDTIKVTQVSDRNELVRNTFCRPFRPVAGMADLYRGWAATNGTAFHYVSASPWQLYLPLAEFVRSNGFPRGSFHLRNFRVKDGTFLDLFRSPEHYKLTAIEALLERYPHRRFVLVGDSGERDPEVYAELARRHPNQVAGILIRDVTGESTSAPRYVRVFAGLPANRWRVFEQPSQIK